VKDWDRDESWRDEGLRGEEVDLTCREAVHDVIGRYRDVKRCVMEVRT